MILHVWFEQQICEFDEKEDCKVITTMCFSLRLQHLLLCFVSVSKDEMGANIYLICDDSFRFSLCSPLTKTLSFIPTPNIVLINFWLYQLSVSASVFALWVHTNYCVTAPIMSISVCCNKVPLQNREH